MEKLKREIDELKTFQNDLCTAINFLFSALGQIESVIKSEELTISENSPDESSKLTEIERIVENSKTYVNQKDDKTLCLNMGNYTVYLQKTQIKPI